MKLFLVLSLLIATSITTVAQAFRNWIESDSVFSLKPYAMLQIWGTGSFDQMVDEDGDGNFSKVDDRFNLQIRRGRLGLKGTAYHRLDFNVVLFYDLIGRDVLSATRGGSNNPPSNVGLWDAYISWRLGENDLFHITGGFFRPQLGRESITSAWNVNSFEKSASQGYIRDLLVGTSAGRAAGLNMGGQKKLGDITANYNVGIFNPQNTGTVPDTQGLDWNPLYVARVVLSVGDPESENYGISYQTNYFNDRKGISLGLGTSHQWGTDLFQKSESYQADLLFNHGSFNLSGEIALMTRSDRFVDFFSYTGFLRFGYNVVIREKYLIEPSVMYTRFESEDDPTSASQAATFGLSDGRDKILDLGINWYLDENSLKIALHYTIQSGSGVNNGYSFQNGVGSVKRGDYLGLGITAILD